MADGAQFMPRPAERRKSRVLLVDDNEAHRYATAHRLHRAGYDVVEAATGGECLRRLDTKPDLIVLDVRLPDINGFEVCRRIKSDPATRSLPVLHLSAHKIKPVDKAQGLQLGADGYLAEPVEAGEFLATVHSLLRMRESEEEAKALALKWQTTFDAISDGICLLLPDGTISRCNEAMGQLLGAKASALTGWACLPALEEQLGPIAKRSELTIAGLEARRIVETAIGARHFRITIDPLPHSAGTELAGAVQVMTDITDRKRAEDALRESEKRFRRLAEDLSRSNRDLEHFAHIASHDLQEPLRMISSYVGLLAKRYGESLDERATEYIAFALDGTKRMKALIDDLLRYSKLSKSAVAMARVDVGPVVDSSLKNLEVAIRESHTEIAVEPMPTVHGDAIQISQVFQNLIANAIKFRRDDTPRVRIGCREEDAAAWRFTVEDNGIGFEMSYAERIFEIFRRLHTHETYPGAGIGLALCRKIIENHGGRIWAESQPGRGSAFHFTLPRLA